MLEDKVKRKDLVYRGEKYENRIPKYEKIPWYKKIYRRIKDEITNLRKDT